MEQKIENDLMMLKASEKYDELYRYLFKLNNKKLNARDKWNILYKLCWTARRLNLDKDAEYYILQAYEIIKDYKELDIEGAKTIWMILEIFKNKLTKDEALQYYKDIKKCLYFYKEDSDMINAINFNMSLLNDDKEDVKKYVKIAIKNNYINLLKGMLNDLNKSNDYSDIIDMINNKLITSSNDVYINNNN